MKLKLKLKFEKLIECQSFNLIVALIHNSNAKEGYRPRMFQNQRKCRKTNCVEKLMERGVRKTF